MAWTSWNKKGAALFLLVLGLSIFCFGKVRVFALETLSLDQAIQMALERSPELQEAQQDVVAAQSELRQAKAGRWAQLDVVGILGPTRDAKTPIVVSSPNANGVMTGVLQDRDENSIGIFGSLDFFIVQPIYTFGKISNRKDAAEFGVEAQRAAKEKKRGEVIFNVKQLYYALVVAKQGKDSAEDADHFVRDARKRIQRLLELGSTNVADTDVYRLEAFETQINQFRAKAESGYHIAHEALKREIGYPLNQDFELNLKELPKGGGPLRAEDAYVKLALERRPELQQLNKGIGARRALLEAARADLYPSVFIAAVGSFAAAPGRERLDPSYFHDDFNHSEAGVVLGTQWHFDLGIGWGKVDQAKAEYEKLIFTKEYAERNIPLQVIKYYQDAVEARKSYESFDKGAKASRKWIISAFTNFDMGVGTAKDMFEAIERYGKNQGDYLVSLYNYHVAMAGLSYASGEYTTGSP
jgi:outer membrane protein